jgi:hypothetical protein
MVMVPVGELVKLTDGLKIFACSGVWAFAHLGTKRVSCSEF